MRIPIVREGFYFIAVFFILCLVFYILGKYCFPIFFAASCVFFILGAFTMFFFRDPYREITKQDGAVISPADGVVFDITDAEDEFFDGRKIKAVKIFLSVFNAHIQRAPSDGMVKLVKYKQGKFLPANDEKADIENEQNIIGFESPDNSRVLIKQIAGIIARRIVCWVKEGEEVKTGDKVGLIKFGSQVDIHLPENSEILVKKGDKVKAGITIIAKKDRG